MALIVSLVSLQITVKKKTKDNLGLERPQRARDELNKGRTKRLDFTDKKLWEKDEARPYINNADKAMLRYYHVFTK